MLNTIALFVSGALLMGNPMAASTEYQAPKNHTEIVAEDGKEVIAYEISVETSFEEMDKIQAAAEEAGMGFTYKKRGVSKTKLIIDMVIENEDDYEMKRVVVTNETGPQTLQWMANDKGLAVDFVDEGDNSLTRN